MVVISASLAAVLYLQLEFPLAEAGRIGFGTLMLMVLAEFFAARNDARTMVETELGAIFETAAGLGRETAAMTTRVAALEGSLERRIDEAVDPRLEALTAEMHELELTVARLREEVARLRTPRTDAAGRRHRPLAKNSRRAPSPGWTGTTRSS